MPAPTTNLTAQFDASTTTHLWKLWQSGTPFHNTTPAHGDPVEVWDVSGGTASVSFLAVTSHTPVLNLTSPVMPLPSLKFDPVAVSGPQMTMHTPAFGTATMDALVGPTAFVIGVAFRIISATSSDSVLALELPADISVGITNTSGVYSLNFYNKSGGSYTNFSVGGLAANTNYVFVYWHTGGSIFAEVYNAGGLAGSGSTVSGNTDGLADQLVIGQNYNASSYAAIYLGEMVFYNAYVAGDRSTLTTYLTGKWLTGAPPVLPPPVLSTMTPASAYANASVPVKLVGVAFTGTYLDGTAGVFDPVSGFTFSNLSIASGGLSGTVDIQIATAKAAGTYNFTFTTAGGTSSGTSSALVFTISSPSGGTSGDTGGNVRFNAGFN